MQFLVTVTFNMIFKIAFSMKGFITNVTRKLFFISSDMRKFGRVFCFRICIGFSFVFHHRGGVMIQRMGEIRKIFVSEKVRMLFFTQLKSSFSNELNF